MFDLLICLAIETDEKIESISAVLNTHPTDAIIKGEQRSKIIAAAEKNIWMYDEKHRECKEIGRKFVDFFDNIHQIFVKIEELKKLGRVSLRVSIISEFAQIGVCFSEKDLNLLNYLNIPLEISILSWGQCLEE